MSANHNHQGEDCHRSHKWGVWSQSAARLILYILVRGQFQGPPTACLAQPGSLMQHRRASREHRRRGHCTRIKVRLACGSTEVSCPAVAPVPSVQSISLSLHVKTKQKKKASLKSFTFGPFSWTIQKWPESADKTF